MHTGIIFLTKADDPKEAIETVSDYLNNNVIVESGAFDWFVIGGRWTGFLNPLFPEYEKQKKERIKGDDWDKMNKEQQDAELNNIWGNLEKAAGVPDGEVSLSPCLRPNEAHYDDAWLAIDIADRIKEYDKNTEKMKNEARTELLKYLTAKDKDKKNDTTQYYWAGVFRDLGYGYLCPDTRVYNIETSEAGMPSDLLDYYAVMVDLHF